MEETKATRARKERNIGDKVVLRDTVRALYAAYHGSEGELTVHDVVTGKKNMKAYRVTVGDVKFLVPPGHIKSVKTSIHTPRKAVTVRLAESFGVDEAELAGFAAQAEARKAERKAKRDAAAQDQA